MSENLLTRTVFRVGLCEAVTDAAYHYLREVGVSHPEAIAIQFASSAIDAVGGDAYAQYVTEFCKTKPDAMNTGGVYPAVKE